MSYCGPPVNVSASDLNEKHETIVRWVLAAFSLTVSPFTIILNAMIITAVTQKKELQKHSNILLSSIALADFLTGIASIPAVTTSLVTVHQDSLELVCTINRIAISLEGFFLFCSLYHLTMVAWERFVAIRKFMVYKVIVTKSRLIKMAIFAWLSAIFTWLPLFMMSMDSVDISMVRIGILIINGCGAINVVTIVYFYAMVYHEIRKTRTSDVRVVTTQLQAKRESTVAKTTGLITAALLFTIALGNILPKVLLHFSAFRLLFHFSRTVVRLNSVLNPVLYCYRDHRFRKAVLELLRIRKTQTTQKTDGSVPFRGPKNQYGSPLNVQRDQKNAETEKVSTRATRSTSCEAAISFADEKVEMVKT